MIRPAPTPSFPSVVILQSLHSHVLGIVVAEFLGEEEAGVGRSWYGEEYV